MTGDPRTYDYSEPTRSCDVVMKGGITSGVVYPHALCELARTYRFANVGGTSAGAIAAAGAAAAEYGRDRGGFQKLAALPEWIGGGENLVGLFQPSPGTRSYHRLLMSGLGRTGAGKWLRVAGAALRSFPLAAVLGLAPGLALAVLAVWTGSGALAVCAVIAGIVLALLGLVLALGLQLAVGLPRALGRNGFGLCPGLSPEGSAAPALTPWLAALIDDLAAKDGDGPLTFGDLRAKGIELQMMTTNITHRRPHRMRGRVASSCSTPTSFGACSPSAPSRGWRRIRRRSARARTPIGRDDVWTPCSRCAPSRLPTTSRWSSPRA